MRVPTAASSRTGSGEPVLLVHPFATSHHIWAGVAAELSSTHDVLAVSIAGHWGGPRVPFRQVSVQRYADELERAMDEAGWSTAHIVGNSLGGWLAFELERRGRARSVTAIAPAGGWRRYTWDEFAIGMKFVALLPAVIVGRLFGDLVLRRRLIQRIFLRTVAHRPERVTPEAAVGLLRAASTCDAYVATIWAGLRDGGITGLDGVRAPTLLALCEHDWFIPAQRYGRMFDDDLPPAAERITLPGVGHVPMLEDPQLIARTIGTFVAKHTPAVADQVLERPQSA